MEARVRLVEGMQLVGRADSGHAVVLDLSPEAGGQDTAARPMELVLIGLAGCTAVDVINILRKRRKTLRRLEVYARAERAAEPPRVFTAIELEYVIAGDFTPQEVERAIMLSETKYCSVAAMLKPSVPITARYRIEAA